MLLFLILLILILVMSTFMLSVFIDPDLLFVVSSLKSGPIEIPQINSDAQDPPQTMMVKITRFLVFQHLNMVQKVGGLPPPIYRTHLPDRQDWVFSRPKTLLRGNCCVRALDRPGDGFWEPDCDWLARMLYPIRPQEPFHNQVCVSWCFLMLCQNICLAKGNTLDRHCQQLTFNNSPTSRHIGPLELAALAANSVVIPWPMLMIPFFAGWWFGTLYIFSIYWE